MPRVAALIDVMQVSDITKVLGPKRQDRDDCHQRYDDAAAGRRGLRGDDPRGRRAGEQGRGRRM